jgi:peptidoglycan/xylan/chitin deacetylase (PgdA/CDA1 family)
LIRKNLGTTVVLIMLIALTSFLLPIAAHSQILYLPNAQLAEKNQGNQESTITARNESNNSIPSNSGYASNSNANKVVIINFDDSHKSQYEYAKPILDKYGFKATFFEVCDWIGTNHDHDLDNGMSWQDIAALQHDGMDIESHTMTHPHLNELSPADLDYEIGQSKQCLIDHRINATIFAYPYSDGSNNSTVVNTVAKYYYLARTDSKFPLTFLHCDGGSRRKNRLPFNQTNCGTSTFANRYSINSWSHRHIEGDFSYVHGVCTTGVCRYYNNSQMLDKFIANVNSQNNYNTGGIIRAIPIIIYHTIVTYPDVSYSKRPVDTTVNLFDAEMKYLHDNGFRVLTMADLGYDENGNYIYIKNTSQSQKSEMVFASNGSSNNTQVWIDKQSNIKIQFSHLPPYLFVGNNTQLNFKVTDLKTGRPLEVPYVHALIIKNVTANNISKLNGTSNRDDFVTFDNITAPNGIFSLRHQFKLEGIYQIIVKLNVYTGKVVLASFGVPVSTS